MKISRFVSPALWYFAKWFPTCTLLRKWEVILTRNHQPLLKWELVYVLPLISWWCVIIWNSKLGTKIWVGGRTSRHTWYKIRKDNWNHIKILFSSYRGEIVSFALKTLFAFKNSCFSRSCSSTLNCTASLQNNITDNQWQDSIWFLTEKMSHKSAAVEVFSRGSNSDKMFWT